MKSVKKGTLAILLFLCATLCTFSVFSQMKISTVDYYGEEGVDTVKLMQIASAVEGYDLLSGEALLRSKLHQIKGVRRFLLKKVCCDAKGVNIFVGLSTEENFSSFKRKKAFRDVTLPDDLLKVYQEYLDRLKAAIEKGEREDNLELGYSLMKNEAVRHLQQKLPEMVSPHQKILAQVMRCGVNAGHRAAAAFLMGYCRDQRLSLLSFQDALSDPNPEVRNNALRAMTAILVSGRQNTAELQKASRSKILEMLYSPEWTDRDKAMFALVAITQQKDPSFLATLKDKAGIVLKGMSRWKSRPHALLAYILLGRIAGKSEERIFQDWQAGKML